VEDKINYLQKIINSKMCTLTIACNEHVHGNYDLKKNKAWERIYEDCFVGGQETIETIKKTGNLILIRASFPGTTRMNDNPFPLHITFAHYDFDHLIKHIYHWMKST
jgi:hypothetical protein